MSIRLLYITNDPIVGRIAERAGVDWIFVDLEYRGKASRQANRDTVISAHTIEDVLAMRKAITSSRLMVRINPIGERSADEIDNVVQAGADIVMLPYFKTLNEVQYFLSLVAGRVDTCLLLETMDCIAAIDEILSEPGIDFVHVGLNDLHIERKTTFMFEFLSDGSMDLLAARLKKSGVAFGFGGMAKIGELLPPAERILAEHYRLGSSGVILSRSFSKSTFTRDSQVFEKDFYNNVRAIREVEAVLQQKNNEFFQSNKIQVVKEVMQVVDEIRSRK